MNTGDVLNGIAAGDRITAGMYFRLTFAPLRRLGVAVEFFSFQIDIQVLFDKLDAEDGLAQPSSTLAVAPGQQSAVFDVLVRPAAIGISAADLANYFDDLRFGISLTSMTPIDVRAVLDGAAERDRLQRDLSAAEEQKGLGVLFGDYARYLEWILVLVVILALLYYAPKAYKLVRALI